MKRALFAAGLIIALGLMGACSKQAPEDVVDPVEAAWSAMLDAYNEAETAEAKVELFEGFLAQFPDTEQAGRLASAEAYYRGTELGDPEGALAVLQATRDKNTNPEARYQIGLAMFPLSVTIGEPMDLDAVAQELAAARELGFGELIEVADLAVEHEQWEVGAKYAEAALTKATPEAFLADYPDEDYTQEEAVAKADRRRAMSLADLGWALYNLGETEKAMEVFEQGVPLKTVDYLGVADTPIDLYLGKAKLAAGDADTAIELLTPAAIMGSSDDAMHALREAYVAVNGGEDGFDGWLWSQRQRLAKPVDDFTLADYEGTMHDFSALSDGKVTLLAFWFPT